jgi:hypothetical protein
MKNEDRTNVLGNGTGHLKENAGVQSNTHKTSDEVYVSTLVGDNKIVDQVIELAKSEDDPPIIFGWDDQGLHEFWDKAVAYGALGAIPPPNQINGEPILWDRPTEQPCATSRLRFNNLFGLK